MVSVRLESWYVPDRPRSGLDAAAARQHGSDALAGFQLAFTTVVQLTPDTAGRARQPDVGLARRRSAAGTRLEPGATWELELTCGHRPGHANDGPTGAYVILADGSTVPVRTTPTVRVVAGSARALRLTTADPADRGGMGGDRRTGAPAAPGQLAGAVDDRRRRRRGGRSTPHTVPRSSRSPSTAHAAR